MCESSDTKGRQQGSVMVSITVTDCSASSHFARVQMPREPLIIGSAEAGLLTSPPSRRRLPGDDADNRCLQPVA